MNRFKRPITKEQIIKTFGHEVLEIKLKDPVQNFRISSGIEMMYDTNDFKELMRTWNNFNKMPDRLKILSDKKLIQIYGMKNKDFFTHIIKTKFPKYKNVLNVINIYPVILAHDNSKNLCIMLFRVYGQSRFKLPSYSVKLTNPSNYEVNKFGMNEIAKGLAHRYYSIDVDEFYEVKKSIDGENYVYVIYTDIKSKIKHNRFVIESKFFKVKDLLNSNDEDIENVLEIIS